MTDERIDALLRRLDVPSDPDPDFMRSTYAMLRPRARAARVSDMSRIGRLRRDLRLLLAGARWPSPARPVAIAGPVVLLVLLALATMVGLAVVGTLNRSEPIRSVPSTGPSAVVAPPRAPMWTATGEMTEARTQHTATLLLNGKVLVAGGRIGPDMDGSTTSAELYDPGTGTWTPTGSMRRARDGHTATRLLDGSVLVVGAEGTDAASSTAELYDPISGTWTATGDMLAPGIGHTATLLPDGKVLVVGGHGNPRLAELYDPASGTWTATGRLPMIRLHIGHAATLLPDGRVLVTGGPPNGSDDWRTAELYGPGSGSWTVTGDMVRVRLGHTATLLPDGRVLVAGGSSKESSNAVASAELYDPTSGTWTATRRMVTIRGAYTATLLLDGRVLVTGGTSKDGKDVLASAEIYGPGTRTWTAAPAMDTPLAHQTATLLPDGRVLVAGGISVISGTARPQASAELYDPGSGN